MVLFFVDSFTNEALKGNPAAVCFIDKEMEASEMLLIAQEIGFSETAFVLHKEKTSFNVRYFSPKMEIPLCGHATLAASKVIFSQNPDCVNISFKTYSGLILKTESKNDEVS
jgi:PhzF family phenazine biosynthesis protein